MKTFILLTLCTFQFFASLKAYPALQQEEAVTDSTMNYETTTFISAEVEEDESLTLQRARRSTKEQEFSEDEYVTDTTTYNSVDSLMELEKLAKEGLPILQRMVRSVTPEEAVTDFTTDVDAEEPVTDSSLHVLDDPLMEMGIFLKKVVCVLQSLERSDTPEETVTDSTSDVVAEEVVTSSTYDSANSLMGMKALVKEGTSLLQRMKRSVNLEEEIVTNAPSVIKAMTEDGTTRFEVTEDFNSSRGLLVWADLLDNILVDFTRMLSIMKRPKPTSTSTPSTISPSSVTMTTIPTEE